MVRKLEVGGVLERVFGLYRAHVLVLLPAALIVFLLVDLVDAIILNGGYTTGRVVVTGAIAFVGTVWYQGLVVEAVAETHSSARRLQLPDLFRAVQPRLGTLLLAGLLFGAAITVPAIILALVLPGALAAILIVILALTLLTLWALIAPVILVEHSGAIDAFRRSRGLVAGNAWRVFGVVLVVYIIQYIVTDLVQGIGSGSFFGYFLLTLIASTLTAPLAGLAVAIMYFDLARLHDGALPDDPAAPARVAAGWDAPVPGGAVAGPEPLAAREPDLTARRQAAPFADHAQTGASRDPGVSSGAERAAEPEPTHPADWYPDPRREARLRYWDGTAWTSHTAD